MRSKRVQNRNQKAQPTIQAAFAFADVMVEASRRGLGKLAGQLSQASPEQAGGDIFVLLGRHLEHQRQQMVAADDHYQELQAQQRQRRLQRDAIAKRGYTLLVDTRKMLRGWFGEEGAGWVLGRLGPSQREPRALHLQVGEAVWWARNWQFMPEPKLTGGNTEAEKCVVLLEELYAELDEVIDAIGLGDRQVEAAMLAQREAMADFDRAYRHGAEVIEAQLIQVGLPTLAAAVRPGIGRRGRPLKQRPVDLYPDLVEQVRAQGSIELESADSKDARNQVTNPAARLEEAGSGCAPDVASGDAVGNGVEAVSSVSNGVRNDLAAVEKIAQPVHKRSLDEEVIEQPLHKRSESDEKSAHLVHKGSEGDEKSEQAFHKRSEGDEESEQRFHKPPSGELSHVSSRFNVPASVGACGQDPRRHDLRRRPGGPMAGRATGKSVRQAKASWWRRLMRVA